MQDMNIEKYAYDGQKEKMYDAYHKFRAYISIMSSAVDMDVNEMYHFREDMMYYIGPMMEDTPYAIDHLAKFMISLDYIEYMQRNIEKFKSFFIRHREHEANTKESGSFKLIFQIVLKVSLRLMKAAQIYPSTKEV